RRSRLDVGARAMAQRSVLPAASGHDELQVELARVRATAFEPFTLFRVPPTVGRYINVSPVGYRHGSRGTAWPPDPGAIKLYIFGGWTAFGYEVADDETFASQLADRLVALLPGQPLSVYNFASPNYCSEQERIRLEQLLLDGHLPQVAIFVDGFDEFLWPYYAPEMLQRFGEALRRRSTGQLTGAALRAILRRLLPEGAARWLAPGSAAARAARRIPDPAVVLDRYLANKRLIEAVCASFDVQPLFVWQPVPCYHYDGVDRLPRLPPSRVRDLLLECIRSGYELMNERRR